MKGKFIYLLKNTGLFLLSNFSSKFLVILLIPLYTNVLTTEEYGSYDLIYTTIQMLIPILSLNIVDGVMRYTIGQNRENQKTVFTIGIKYITVSFLIVMGCVVAAHTVFHVDIIGEFSTEFLALYFSFAFYQLINQFVRGLEDTVGIAIASFLSTLSMLAFNILFLLVFKFGLRGYFYAYVLSFLIPAGYLFIKDKLYSYMVFHRNAGTYKDIRREMLAYSFPLLINTLGWYVNGAADRYVITFFCGLGLNGIYSVAHKIPAIMNALQNVFIQAWQLSAIREYGSQDDISFYRIVYKVGYAISLLFCSMLILLTRFLAHMLFAKDFFQAWQLVPILLIYVFFNMLSGIIGGVFTATKETKLFANSALAGAMVNIVLNLILVKYFAATGAAVATMISSVVIWKFRMIYAQKSVDFEVNKVLQFVELFLLCLQAVIAITLPNITGYILQTAIIGIFITTSFFKLKPIIKK